MVENIQNISQLSTLIMYNKIYALCTNLHSDECTTHLNLIKLIIFIILGMENFPLFLVKTTILP